MPACLDTPALLLCLSNALFARLHASQNASKLPSGDAPQFSATRRGIVVDYPTKTKSLVPSGPASSGENTQFPIAPRHGLIRFRAGFLTAPRNTGTGIPPSPHPGSGCQPPSYAPLVPAQLLCLASALFARLHASQNASKLPSGDAPQSSATRRGIVVDYPTKTKSLFPSGPASSGENTQFPIDQSRGLIRFRAGFPALFVFPPLC